MSNTGKAEIRKLNTIRGIAALIVLVSHYSNDVKLFDGYLGNGSGQIGVMLFFILSGFLMAHLYINRPWNADQSKNFLVARVARVLPLFYLVVLLSYLLTQFTNFRFMYPIDGLSDFLSHTLLLSGKSILWTIPAEIHFYLIFVFLWLLYFKHKLAFYISITIITLLALFFRLDTYNYALGSLDLKLSILWAIPYFLIGCFFGIIYTRVEFKKHGVFVLALPALMIIYPNIFVDIFGMNHTMWNSPLIFAFLSVVFFAVVFLTPDSNRFLANKIGDFLGKISYSLYLWHLPILIILYPYAKSNPLIFFFIFLAISLVASYLSFKLFESPCRKYLKRLIDKR